MADSESVEFGKLAVALRFLLREDLEKALKLQADLDRVGVQKRLGEILLEKKMLTREQVLLVLRGQGKRILACRACRKSYNVHGYRTDEVYTCKHCGEALAIPFKVVEASVSDSILVSTRELRAIQEAPKPKKAGESGVSKAIANLLPGYEITERLGQGGMGMVYKARDLIGKRWVAVKVLAPFLANDEEYVNRFFQEARNLQKLHHPNIVEAFDAGEAGTHKFFIMEYVDGAPMDQVLEKKGRLSEHAALEIIRQVAQALDYAWTLKIVHRDIKPQNLMITRAKTVKLCDLGLSKDVTSDLSLTMTGSVNCSPPYASPEQAQGAKEIDVRSDVYSLGVTLFQAVCGELPFKGQAPGQFLIQHVTKEAPDPCKVNPKLSPGLGKLILKMLSKQISERPYPGDLAKAVTRFLNRHEAKAGVK
jgi:serine/threonine-protein kinase